MLISWDKETHPFDRAQAAPRPVCVSWSQDLGPAKVARMADPGVREMFLEWLTGHARMVGTWCAFDLAVLAEYWPWTIRLIWNKLYRDEIQDIGINEQLLDLAEYGNTDREYSLEALTARHGLPAVDKSGPWRLEYGRLENIPVESWPQGAVDYVLGDADRPGRIFLKQQARDEAWAQRKGAPALHLAGFEMRASFCGQLTFCWGIMADETRARELKASLDQFLEEAKTDLVKAGLVRANGTKDTKKAQAYMAATMEALGLPCRMTDTNAISLDKEACEASGDALLKKYSAYAQAGTLLSRAEDLCDGVKLPLQPSYNTLLETGRTSVRKPKPPFKGVQSQNMPQKVGAREVFTPRPGHVFSIADYEGAESHSLAQVQYDLFGRSVLGDLLNQGKDMHKWFAGVVRGMSYEQFQAWEKQDKAAAKQARDRAKPFNFGLPGGMGWETFMTYAWEANRVKLTPKEAQDLCELWKDAMEIRPYFAHISKLMGKRRGGLATFKHIRSGRWRGRVPYCATANSQFQELTATAAKDAWAEVCRRCYSVKSSALWNSRPVWYTHDEIALETPLEIGHDAAMELTAVMEERFNKWHPDCPTKAPALLTMVYSKRGGRSGKGCEAIYNEQGRLVPWTLAA